MYKNETKQKKSGNRNINTKDVLLFNIIAQNKAGIALISVLCKKLTWIFTANKDEQTLLDVD